MRSRWADSGGERRQVTGRAGERGRDEERGRVESGLRGEIEVKWRGGGGRGRGRGRSAGRISTGATERDVWAGTAARAGQPREGGAGRGGGGDERTGCSGWTGRSLRAVQWSYRTGNGARGWNGRREESAGGKSGPAGAMPEVGGGVGSWAG